MCTASNFTFREIYVGVTPSIPIHSKLHTVYTHGIFTLREIHTRVTRIGNGRRKMHTRVTAKEGSRYVKS